MSSTRFDRIENKLDKLDEKLDAVDKHLAVYNSELVRHIEGVEQNRKRIEELEKPKLALIQLKKWAKWGTVIIGFAMAANEFWGML